MVGVEECGDGGGEAGGVATLRVEVVAEEDEGEWEDESKQTPGAKAPFFPRRYETRG